MDDVPVAVFHITDRDVPQDPSVVDQDVDAAKRLDGRINDPVALFDGVVV
jgi:hypothetical protein